MDDQLHGGGEQATETAAPVQETSTGSNGSDVAENGSDAVAEAPALEEEGAEGDL